MPSLGPLEILIVLVAGLVVFGPQRLPEMGRQIGKALRELRRVQGDVQREIRDAFDPAVPPPGAGQGSPTAATAQPGTTPAGPTSPGLTSSDPTSFGATSSGATDAPGFAGPTPSATASTIDDDPAAGRRGGAAMPGAIPTTPGAVPATPSAGRTTPGQPAAGE